MKNLFGLLILSLVISSCEQGVPQSASGVSKASVKVQTDENGNSIEQKNIIERLHRDNLPRSIKHLYVISAYSGQVAKKLGIEVDETKLHDAEYDVSLLIQIFKLVC